MFPARAGLKRGDRFRRARDRFVFPARAGLKRRRDITGMTAHHAVFPARAGLKRSNSFAVRDHRECSPRVRG